MPGKTTKSKVNKIFSGGKPAGSKRVAEFREITNKVISILTERKINVTQQGLSAFVRYNSKSEIEQLNIPYIPDDASEEVLSAVRGFLDHEVSHVLHTNNAALIRTVKGLDEKEGKRIANLANIIEDPRIERAMRKRFPGTGGNLSYLLRFIYDRGLKNQIEQAIQTNNKKTLFALGLPLLVSHWSGDENATLFVKELDLETHLSEECDLLEPFTAKMPSLNSTDEVCEMAYAIYKALKDRVPPSAEGQEGECQDGEGEKSKNNPKKSKNNKSKSNSNNKQTDKEKSENSSKSEKNNEDENEEDGEQDQEDSDNGKDGDEGQEDGEGQEEGDEPGEGDEGQNGEAEAEDEGDGSDESKGKGQGETNGNTKQVSGEMTEALDNVMDSSSRASDVIKSSIADSVSKNSYLVYTTDYDKVIPVTVGEDVMDMVDAQISKTEEQTRSLTGQMQSHLRRMLAQQSFSINHGGLRSGKLQQSSLHRLTLNDDRVFFRREEHEAQDTVVTLLIDNSGSMGGHKVKMACTAGFALAQALTRLSVPFEILGFTTSTTDLPYSLHGQMIIEQKNIGRNFSRFKPIVTYEYKKFSDVFNIKVKRRLVGAGGSREYSSGYYSRNTGGFDSQVEMQENVDGESLLIAASRIGVRHEQRKIIMVLSDGQPSCGSTSELAAHLSYAVAECEKRNIETIGIGIDDASVKKFYPKNIVINDVEELPTKVIGELKKFMIGKRTA